MHSGHPPSPPTRTTQFPSPSSHVRIRSCSTQRPLFSTASYTITAHCIASTCLRGTSLFLIVPLSKHDVDPRHNQHSTNDCDDWVITTTAAVTTPTMAAATTVVAIADYNHDQYNPQ
ncbi:hypothetical protein EDB85DRAFT_1985516 [Lactarius pseudohatsudake]|nr:hypothetical protein EDB85DRAFT_1985516 [Lactarius pseudohatsudake]